MPTTLELKKDERLKAYTAAEELRVKYDGKPDPMSADDRTTWEKAMNDFDALSADVKLLERAEGVAAWGAASNSKTLPLAGNYDDEKTRREAIATPEGKNALINAAMRGKAWTTLHSSNPMLAVDARTEAKVLAARQVAASRKWDAVDEDASELMAVEDPKLRRQLKATQAEHYGDLFLKFIRYAKGDLAMMGDAERKVLQEGGDTSGGFLIPEDFRAELIMKLPTFTAIRPRATVIETARDIVRIPRMNYTSATDDTNGNLFTWPGRLTWVGSDVPASSSSTDVTDPPYGQVAIVVHTAMAGIRITRDLLEDAAFDLMTYLGQKFIESYNLGEDSVYINGTGQGQPMGLLYAGNPDLPSTTKSTSASTFTADSLIQLFYDLPIQYRAASSNCFMMASDTARIARQLKDSQNRYVWGTMQVAGAGLSVDAQPDSLLGRPVAIDEFMPAVAANALPIVFGDWSGYTIVDRVGLAMQVLQEVYAEVNQVKLVTRRRLGGATTEPWKFRALKITT